MLQPVYIIIGSSFWNISKPEDTNNRQPLILGGVICFLYHIYLFTFYFCFLCPRNNLLHQFVIGDIQILCAHTLALLRYCTYHIYSEFFHWPNHTTQASTLRVILFLVSVWSQCTILIIRDFHHPQFPSKWVNKVHWILAALVN